MKFLLPILKSLGNNKYWVVISVATLIICVFDENSLISRMQLTQRRDDLAKQIEQYNAEFENNQKILHDIAHDKETHAVTKIARERYLMKAEDEDVFVFEDEMPKGMDAGAEGIDKMIREHAGKK